MKATFLSLALAVSLFSGCLSSRGATISAATPSLADVSSAIASASNGDTVLVPAGTANWNSTLTLAKTITLQGAGKYLTRFANNINAAGNNELQPLIAITGTGGIRIRDIEFDGQWQVPGGKGIIIYNGNVRVDHCYFHRSWDRAIQVFAASAILIDHNIGVDDWAFAGVYADQFAAFQRPLGLGTTNAIYFEDNYIVKTGAYYAPVVCDGGYGGKYVWRFNIVSNLNTGQGLDYVLDAHGNQGSPYGGGATIAGTVSVEAYNNLHSMASANRGSYIRGGTMLFYNNAWFATGGNMLQYGMIHMVTEEDGYRAGNPIRTDWPGYNGITNSYFFNNYLNGVKGNGIIWEFPGMASCGNPAGCQGLGTDNRFIQFGRDFFDVAPSTSFYLPLQYPHPRIPADNDPPVPTSFAISSPSNGASSVSTQPTFTWADSDIETNYIVIVSTNRIFSAVVMSNMVPANTTSYLLPGGVLVTNTTYYAKIMARGVNGVNVSANSPITFTTGAAPPSSNFGSLQLATNLAAVAEDSGTYNVVVQRVGGSDQLVTVNYTTSPGTAIAGVNYTTTSGTLTWTNLDMAYKTVPVTILVDGVAGPDKSLTFVLSSPAGGATLGAPTTETITIQNTDTPPAIPLMAGLSFHAYQGQITSPGTTNMSGYFYQPAETTVASGGRVAWRVTIPSTGYYFISNATVIATAPDRNSFGVNWDTDPPTDPYQVWSITPLTGPNLESRTVSWVGNGTVLSQFPTNVWSLTAGVHTLYIRGREGNTFLDLVEISELAPPVPQTFAWATTGVQTKENIGPMMFPIDRRGDTNGTVSVNYATLNGSALVDVNYVATSGTATFTNGVIRISVPVTLINNDYFDVDKYFFMILSAPVGGTIEVPTSILGVIEEDDTRPKRTATIGNIKAGTVQPSP